VLVWFAIFVAVGAAGTWLARRYALAHALVDEPGERRSHTVPTPRGGGIAIVVALLMATAGVATREPAQFMLASAFAGGLSAVALVGLIDDHRPLSPWIRLLVHVAAAGALALAWGLHGGDWSVAFVAFAACVCLTNVWNFMDGINGIAATQAALVGLAVVLSIANGWALVALALAASCIGFLPFNVPRAHIFLGDVGSGALGYSIAALGLLSGVEAGPAPSLIPMAISAFLIDAALTLLRRILRGERWWAPHVQHAYQVCARRWGHVRVTVSYGIWTVISIFIAGVADAAVDLTWAVIAAWYISGALLWLWLQHRYRRSSGMDAAGTTARGHDGYA
jgi:UDP-N-acetylmuramyl pentapeptide phosphotransferase/UDP-N-acetylglucosamine-1-phosphate transferase